MIKDMLVYLSPGEKADAASAYAISMARLMEAHLTGVAFAHDPTVPGSIFPGVAASIAATYRAESRNAAQAAVTRFEASARGASIATETRVVDTTIDGAPEAFGRLARRYDISVVCQAEASTRDQQLIIEGALFGSGRPVLVVPYIHTQGCSLNRALLGWDGSRHAARAFADAMPLLARCKSIEVITVASKDSPKGEISGTDMAHHLARHGLKVELKRIVAPDADVDSIMLSEAADFSADLIVMGGFGHSRLREFVLGGATRGILAAMTVPTLMSH